ncbi:MAG: hypothetical protein JXA94_07240 [Parachlamydiales bacterium]|nr:hypothetical protein [Parachlamydiales bacterium]
MANRVSSLNFLQFENVIGFMKRRYKIAAYAYSSIFTLSSALEGLNRFYLKNRIIDYIAIPSSVISLTAFAFCLSTIHTMHMASLYSNNSLPRRRRISQDDSPTARASRSLDGTRRSRASSDSSGSARAAGERQPYACPPTPEDPFNITISPNLIDTSANRIKRKYKIAAYAFLSLFFSSAALEVVNRFYLKKKIIDYITIPSSVVSFLTFSFCLSTINTINSIVSYSPVHRASIIASPIREEGEGLFPPTPPSALGSAPGTADNSPLLRSYDDVVGE